MMQNCEFIENNKVFWIEETKLANEKVIVYKSPVRKQTTTVYSNMKRGGAFKGWTPSFIVKP